MLLLLLHTAVLLYGTLPLLLLHAALLHNALSLLQQNNMRAVLLLLVLHLYHTLLVLTAGISRLIARMSRPHDGIGRGLHLLLLRLQGRCVDGRADERLPNRDDVVMLYILYGLLLY